MEQTNEWTEVKSDNFDPIWQPKEAGEALEGVLLEKKTEVGKKASRLYTIENAEGRHGVWGSAVLDQRMATISEGTIVRLTYKGKEHSKKTGNSVHIWKVETKAIS